MGRRGPFRWGLALAVVLVAQHTVGEDICRTGCKGAASKVFKYTPGTTYKYNYEGKIDITLSSAEGQVTTTEVKAVVLLTQLPDCDQILRLQNVQILGTNGKKLGQIPDIEKPIRINFNDGQIEDSICIEPGDTQNSLNIKRAIASMFQVNPKNNYETDVFGVCATETAQHQEGNILVVQKSRHLNKCSYREHIKQDFFTTAFNLHSEIKSSPILDGEYNSKIKIKNGILDQANVVENYLYTPFSVGKNGAKAQVTSKLHLTGTSTENPKVQVSKPRSIIFENPHPVVAPTSNINIILNAVKDVVKSIDIVVGEQTAKEFVNLIKTVRASKKDDLLAVYNQVKSGVGFSSKDTANRVFLDALLQAGTGDTVEVSITLLENNELSEIDRRLVYIGMSYVRHATESSLTTAATLLNKRDLPFEGYLGIGNLAGRYCRQHSCENSDAVNKLIQKLISKLGDTKAANKNEENEMIFALKALANIGYLSDNGLQKIMNIAQNKQAPNRLRVVALETYLADACKDKLRNSALHILQDIQQDSEVRIKAYLVLAQCPTAKIGNAVKVLLEKEPSNQVGGFIVSHIRNVKASANPDKDLAKRHLAFSLPKKFPIDPRKYSYNAEFSYAIDTLGLAAASEANIIYSQDSYLPRSSSLNLTAEIFGHSINFLEIQTRQENFDRLIEHYFGPKGVLKTSSIGELLKNEKYFKQLIGHLDRKLSQTVRGRRDVSRAEIDKIGNAVLIKDNVLNKDLDVDLSVKALGAEVFFGNLNVYQSGLTPEAIIDKICDAFGEGLDKLKNFKETLRSNLLFLDVEFDYPTGLGFPLRLAVEGTSNIQVEAEGQINVRSLLKSGDDLIHLKLVPSANIEVTGRLTLDALVAENGLKVVSTLYTATGGDLKIGITNNERQLDIKFGLPVQEQKLISATHEIVSHTRDQSGHETNLPLKFAQGKDFSICLDQLSPFIGLTFCAEINGPNVAGKQIPVLPFPLAGDAKLGVTIENDDVSEYHLRSTFLPGLSAGEFIIETIDKQNKPKTHFQVNAEIYPEKYIRAIFNSPIKNAHAEGRVTSNDQEKSVMLKVGMDQMEFLGKVGVSISGSPGKLTYKPLLVYKTPSGDQKLPLQIEGDITVESQNSHVKYTFNNVKVSLPSISPLTLKGYIASDARDHSADLSLSDGHKSGALRGSIHVEGTLLKFNLALENTVNPLVNFDVRTELKRAPGQFDSSFQLIHGPDLSSKKQMLVVKNNVISQYKSPKDFTFSIKSQASYPLVGFEGSLEFEETPTKLEYDVDVQYNDIKFGSELEVEINKKENGDFQVEFEIHGLDNKVEFKASREIHGEESKIDNELKVNGAKMEVKGKIKHHLQPNNVNVGADLTVIVPTHDTPFKVNSGLKYNPNEFDAHHKVTSGKVIVIDASLKANKQGTANGNLKVNIQKILVVNGHLKSNKGTGNANLLIDAQNIKKQVKLESTFQIALGSLYNVDVTLYPTFGQDKNQKIILSTHNQVTQNSLDSKNNINLLNKKLSFNVNGQKTGDESNGKINGELEITLPDEQYLLGKINMERNIQNDVINGHGITSVEYRKNKNAAGRKASVQATYKNTDFKQGLYDITYNLAADDSNGKNINADVTIKRSKSGDEALVQVTNKIHGSVLKHPVSVALVSKCNGASVGHLEGTASFGPSVIKITEKHDIRGGGTPCSGQLGLQLSTPTKSLKTLKAEISGSILKPKDSSESLQIEGAASLFADDDGSVPEAIVDFKGEGHLKAGPRDGELKGSIHTSKEGPVSVAAGYSLVESGKQKRINGNVALQYGQGKNVKIDASLQRPDELQYKFEADIQTPAENFKKTTLVVNSKHSEDYNHITSNIKATTDGKSYEIDTELKQSDISPLISIKIKNPDGKLSQLYLKGNKVSEKEFGGEIKAICEVTNFLLESKLDAGIENVEEFFIKGTFNCPKINLNKISFEVQNKPGKTGRKIQVNVKSAGKNLLSGNTNYQAREEHGKYIVEGSGNFKVKDESKSANFKYICQRLSKEKNGEQGLEVSFDASIGNKAIDAEFRATDKQIRNALSYCEKNKECAHIELDSKTNRNDIEGFEHILEITVDLRKIGLTHEFGLKSVTKRNNLLIDHTVDAHLQSQETSKYQYSVYVHPKEAGISFTTPKRTVALESKVVTPRDMQQGGKISGEVAFYLDKKNQPNKKASINGFVNVDTQAKLINGEVKATHPVLSRPLSATFQTSRSGTPLMGEVSVTVALDVFTQPAHKVIAVYSSSRNVNSQVFSASFEESLSVKSPGLGIDIESVGKCIYDRSSNIGESSAKLKYHVGNSNHESVFEIKGGRNSLEFLLKLLNLQLLKVGNKVEIGKDEQSITTQISSVNKDVLIGHLEVKNYNTLSYSLGFQNTPKDKLIVTAALIPGQIADVRADHSIASGKNNIFYASLKLDDANFFKPDYNVNSKEIETVILKSRDKVTTFLNDLSKAGKDISNDIRKEASHVGEIAKKSAIGIKPMSQYYASETQKIREEILSDESVKEFVEAFKKVFGAVIESVSEILAKISDIVEGAVQALQTTFAGVIESINKELIPQLKEVLERLTETLVEITKTAIDIAVAYLTTISQVIEKYQPDIKLFAATIGELGQDIARFIQKSYVEARKILTEFGHNIYDEIKASPYFEQLKAQYKEFAENVLPTSEGIVGAMKEVSATVKDAIPPEFIFYQELTELIDATVNYLELKLLQKPVDDVAYVDRILGININVLKKLANLLSAPSYEIPQSDVPVSLDFLRKLPKLVAIKFSPIAHILKDDPTEEIIGFALTLVNHPRKWFAPFPMEAMVVQGQHIFTFDGKHMTFPGNCKYLLARDAVNGNFTIVGTYVNGALSAITLADKQDTLTLKKGGQLLLNGAATELPTRKPDIAAYRNYQIVTLKSTAGAEIVCLPDLSGCGVTISGFYHGQLKGILGNGNSEPYDDFTIPNGKIVTNEGEFGNSYKIGNCQPVTVPTHDHIQEHPTCNKLFGWDSSMKYCYPFIKTDNYKMACVHGINANIEGTELAIAKAYVAACQSHNIPISVPSNLVQCTNGDKPYNVGDTFSVKLPGKAADIVLLLDTSKENEAVYKDLVQPTVQELVKDLAAKGIKDVQFHLITYDGENQWPSHVTVNGKLTFSNKAPNVKFTEAPNKEQYPVGVIDIVRPFLETLESVLHDLSLAFGLDLQARTYTEGSEYPFRVHALKSIIAVTSRPCQIGKLQVLQKIRALLYKNNQLSLNLITPFHGLNVKDAKKTLDVIGFNEDHVFTISQAQKKPEGTSELYKDLQYSDYCVDFTVKNRGNVFVTDNFLNNKEASARKQFIETTAHNIVEELTNLEQGLDCECQMINAYNAQNVCQESYSKEKSRKA